VFGRRQLYPQYYERRPDEGYEIKAFGRRPDGLYDLDTWNEAYWLRFANLLHWTATRDIIVQIEIWDRFDHSRDPWQEDPFNPKNNTNYTAQETGLEPDYPEHPGSNLQPFFYTVPALNNNNTILTYQQKFVNKLLSFTLAYDHLLYCMDNEISGDSQWGQYWSDYIKGKTEQAGVQIETTEMWDKWDGTHRATLDRPDLYSFVDLSQNSHITGQTNWDNAQWVRQHIAAHPRPINSTKIYGADTCIWTERGIDGRHAPQTFWRNLIGGFASSRFHRPPSGLGLSDAAQTHIRSGRMLADAFDFFNAAPDSTHQALQTRRENDAYLSRVPGRQYALYFTESGAVDLVVEGDPTEYQLQWLEIEQNTWHEGQRLDP
jgi:hypothetical protein